MARILINDDDLAICAVLARILRGMGHDVVQAHTAAEGLAAARGEAFDLVFLDVRMPDGSGLDVLPEIRQIPAPPEVIIITGDADPDGAELAVKNGAWDYITKPVTPQNIRLAVSRVLQYREEKASVKPPRVLHRDGIIGSGPVMERGLEQLAQAAANDSNVLITGETGTGKEVFARAIHRNSSRSGGNFVVVDCAALPATLVESILFGHVRGAFTGADRDEDGLISQAHGGTLFLDEVGELPWSMQKAFLRVLEDGRFRPVGSRQERDCDFRLVAATNRDLDQQVTDGRFRRDLLFRLRVLHLEVPPLRDRSEDIQALVMYHTARLCERKGIGIKGFSPEFIVALREYHWPGNVRELVNTLDRALAAAGGEPTLYPTHLPTNIRVELARAKVGPAEEPPPEVEIDPEASLPTLKDFRERGVARLERQYLRELLRRAGRNPKEACRVAGLQRSRLYELLRKYDLSL
ncbi:MAG: sigma-54 dependent transcriptional regulator [Proteobacteria bacterium]|nr:sigma-54 dependent transcriptional regulator [Pseudomonadota bacterium]MBU1741789.1 sigma-54 dependent transcriptional regulator [Pseudomonadota bacterium]